MTQAKRFLGKAFGVFCLLFVIANAQASSVNVSASESLVLNFDLTKVGVEPFTDVYANYEFLSDSQSVGTISIFSGLDATGTEIEKVAIKDWMTGVGVYLPNSAPFLGPGINGIFSGLLTVNAGSFDVTKVFATGFDSTGNLVVTNNVISAVPLPAAAWLFGTGILGLIGFSKRRKEA